MRGCWHKRLEPVLRRRAQPRVDLDIARHVKKCVDDRSWTPRIDKLPYYEGRIAEWEQDDKMLSAG